MKSDIAAISSYYQSQELKPAAIILECMNAGVFNKYQLLQLLECMTDEEFSSFCSEIIVLQHFSEQHKNEEKSPEAMKDYDRGHFRNSIPR
jgi:hypothetical protein